MFISGLIYSPLLNLFNGEKSEIEDCIQWADEKYDSVCKNSDTGVAILYLREQSVYRSLIVTHNGVQNDMMTLKWWHTTTMTYILNKARLSL